MLNIKKLSNSLLVATALTGLMATTAIVPTVADFTGIYAAAQDFPLASQQRADAAAAARNARPKLKSIPGTTERVYKNIVKVQEFMALEPPQYNEAMALLKKQDLNRLNSTERASYLQLMAAVAQSLDGMEEALGYYKDMLAMTAISYGQRDQITFVVGQIEFSNGNLTEALTYLEDWFQYQPTPSITNLIILANVYYVAGMEEGAPKQESDKNFRKAIEFFNWAITKSIADGKEDKENWYAVLRTIHNTLEETDEVLKYAELLATRWPKKAYWTQLSGLYAQAGTEPGLSEAEVSILEKKQLAAYELAHRQGMLDKGREFETMAQLYLYHEVPYLSSKTIAESFEKGLSEESQRNFNLQATALVSGKDLGDAVVPLRKAAELSNDGNLYIQLANVYLQLDKYKEAADAIQLGLDKGDVRRPDQSSLLQGQAYLSLEMFDEARASFREAAKDDRSKKNANNLLKYVDNEEKRIKDIREYLS
ncbi:MAG: hypothetical protein HOM01_04085 [Kordiimonadaceae bacterium]|jgi:tetratricopeptide (TPR) repeat protein|nr:hypothetical protein [Kordiimonadaceae bacterium]